ncbi:MAG: pyridoxamine 5'-phosphate oxidase [Ilumatobacteraceae bacterium]
MTSLRDSRMQYETAGLERHNLRDNPVEQWHRWYADAVEAGVVEPNAMTVATTGFDGIPDARVVLARDVDECGLVFYTNYTSDKSQQLQRHAAAAAVFAWLDLLRQVRVRGVVERVPDAESDEYFASRPRESQIGAWASPQSQVIPDRIFLEQRVAQFSEQFANELVPRPPTWGGWRLLPTQFEFWQGRPSRLHDRFRYTFMNATQGWMIERLAP